MAAFGQYVLHFLFVLVVYAQLIDVRLNGFTALLVDFGLKGEIPGAPGVQMTGFTGYWLVDFLNNVLAAIFWGMGQGPLSRLLLQFIALVGSSAASLYLLMLEAGRTESLSRVAMKYVPILRRNVPCPPSPFLPADQCQGVHIRVFRPAFG